MRHILLTIYIVLSCVLLWQMGYIRTYNRPCSAILCEKKEDAALPLAVAQEEVETKKIPVDVHILCQAIAVAETSNCTTGSALAYNNCHGITRRGGGYVTYAHTDDSFAACEDLWRRKYVWYPDIKLAATWSSPGAAATWLNNVTTAYQARVYR